MQNATRRNVILNEMDRLTEKSVLDLFVLDVNDTSDSRYLISGSAITLNKRGVWDTPCMLYSDGEFIETTIEMPMINICDPEVTAGIVDVLKRAVRMKNK